MLLMQLPQQLFERHLVGDEYLARFAALCGTHDTGLFELIHESAGTVVSYLEFALNHTCRTLLAQHNHAGGFFKQRVERT